MISNMVNSPPQNKFRELRPPIHTVRIKVLGLGGAGQNAINRMIEHGIEGNIEYIAANTDAQALHLSHAPIKILLGGLLTRGQGAGGDSSRGEAAARESEHELRTALHGADLIFLTAGLGGGTGTGSVLVAAEVAREMGSQVVAVVTLPFDFEGTPRERSARASLERLQNLCNTVIVVKNNCLLEYLPRTVRFQDAFYYADDVLRQGIQAIAELIAPDEGQTMKNVGFSDIRRLLNYKGRALMSIGTAKGIDAPREALNAALSRPLNDLGDIREADGVLLYFTGGTSLSLYDIQASAETLGEELGRGVDIEWGACVNPNLGDTHQVILIITGVKTPENPPVRAITAARRAQPSQPKGMVYSELPPSDVFEEMVRSQKTETAPAVDTAPTRTSYNTPSVDLNNLDVPAFMRRRYTVGDSK